MRLPRSSCSTAARTSTGRRCSTGRSSRRRRSQTTPMATLTARTRKTRSQRTGTGHRPGARPLGDLHERGAMSERQQATAVDHAHVLVPAEGCVVTPLLDGELRVPGERRWLPVALDLEPPAERREHHPLGLHGARDETLDVVVRGQVDDLVPVPRIERRPERILVQLRCPGVEVGLEAPRSPVGRPDGSHPRIGRAVAAQRRVPQLRPVAALIDRLGRVRPLRERIR